MADYDIGGHSVVKGNPYTPSFDIGTAMRIQSSFIFQNLPSNLFFYWTANNNMWYSQNAIYFQSEGTEQDQYAEGKLKPFMIMDLDTFKFGMYLWINDAQYERGTPLNQIRSAAKYLTFCCYDDQGIFWHNASLNYLFEEDYNQGYMTGDHDARECYVMLFQTTDNAIYVVNSPTRLEMTVLGRQYCYIPYQQLESGEYSNARSMYCRLVDRDGVDIDEDALDKESDYSDTGGGDGDFDTESDTISVPGLPGLGFANCGLGALYTPTVLELREFATWLYDPSIVDTIARMWGNPMDLIVSLGIIPLTPSHVSAKRNVYIGGTPTGVEMTEINNQFEELDCGSINIKEFYGSAIDYSDTKLSIYLPYIGVRELKTDEVMSGSVGVKYHVDLQTGSLIAYITCQRNKLNAVLYQFESNCLVQLPLIARDFSVLYQSIVKGAADVVTSGSGMSAVGGVASTAMNVMGSKPNVQKSGSIGATGGLMGIRRPFLILERPVSAYPNNFAMYSGLPSNIEARLGDLTGYTEIEEIRCTYLTCTKEEQEAIISKLKQGVII